jgi:hypothetical protein
MMGFITLSPLTEDKSRVTALLHYTFSFTEVKNNSEEYQDNSSGEGGVLKTSPPWLEHWSPLLLFSFTVCL